MQTTILVFLRFFLIIHPQYDKTHLESERSYIGER